MKKLYIVSVIVLLCNATIVCMKRLPENTIELGNEKKARILPGLVYTLNNGETTVLFKDAVVLCDQLVDFLDFDYNLMSPQKTAVKDIKTQETTVHEIPFKLNLTKTINVPFQGLINEFPFKLHLSDDEVIFLFTILNSISTLTDSLTDLKTQKRYYLNQSVFEIVSRTCENHNALNTDILIKMIGVCDFLICPTALNALTRIFVEKSDQLRVNLPYNFNEFPEKVQLLLSKHLKRKTLGIKLNTYIPECTVIDYIILNNGIFPINGKGIDMNQGMKLTSLDGLEIIAHNIDQSSIITIVLSNNYLGLTSDFAALQNFTNLKTLYLHNNHLTHLPNNIFNNLNKLENLYLMHNQLTHLSENIFNNLRRLRILSLDGNFLVELPEKIFYNLMLLRRLYLNNTQLTALPENIFSKLYLLEELYLMNNQLTQLPENIFNNLRKLEVLFLAGNQLTQLPEKIFNNLIALRRLSLNNNQLTELPENIFSNLRQLTMLRLNNNKLTQLPENIFDNFIDLVSLHIDNNPFSQLPEKIKQLNYELNEIED